MAIMIDDPNAEYRMKQAVIDLQNGRPVLVHDNDDREDEVDMIYAAEHIAPEDIVRMRNDAGGLICVAIPHGAAEQLDLPYAADTINHPAAEDEERAYGDHSSFSCWVNYDGTYTGITDNDRARTITELAATVKTGADPDQFATQFTIPGHVPLLRAADGLLDVRQGHTEMGVYLTKKAQVTPAAVVCEMLDDETGDALSVDDAEKYAQEHDMTLLDGETVIGDFKETVRKIQE